MELLSTMGIMRFKKDFLSAFEPTVLKYETLVDKTLPTTFIRKHELV